MQRIVDHIRVPEGQDWREVLYQHQARGQVQELELMKAKTHLHARNINLADPNIAEERELIDMVADLCEARGIQHIPRIAIAESNVPNASSIGGQVVVFTTDIKQRMSKDELRAIVGHELSHHRHTLRDTAATGALGFIGYQGATRLAEPALAMMPKAEGLLSMVTGRATHWLYHAIGAVGAVWAITPWRRYMEVEADKEGAELTSPEHMKGAFLKLEERAQELEAEHGAVEKPSNLVNKVLHRLMEPITVHPKTEDRVKAMDKMSANQR